jgi:hypothetical protein
MGTGPLCLSYQHGLTQKQDKISILYNESPEAHISYVYTQYVSKALACQYIVSYGRGGAGDSFNLIEETVRIKSKPLRLV